MSKDRTRAIHGYNQFRYSDKKGWIENLGETHNTTKLSGPQN